MLGGDATPSLQTIKALPFTTRVINEAMRLYPQPPVLIRYGPPVVCICALHVALLLQVPANALRSAPVGWQAICQGRYT